MCFSDLLPLGFIQLYESVSNSYFHARSLDFLTNSTNTLLEWLRFPGDVLFIVGGILPLLYICWLGVRYRVQRVTLEEPEEILFADVTEPAPEATVP
jgi:nitric oxide reductase subunit B